MVVSGLSYCAGCMGAECSSCVHCLDMPKNGGQGKWKKSCLLRKCLTPKWRMISEASERSAVREQAAPSVSKEATPTKSNSGKVARMEERFALLEALKPNLTRAEYAAKRADILKDI